MIEDYKEQNARITKTMLGKEDHGIFTFMLHLNYGDGGQGAGGWALDDAVLDGGGKFVRRAGTAEGMALIIRILETLEVKTWEDLPGTFCRVRASMGVEEIGHPLKNQWLNFRDHFGGS